MKKIQQKQVFMGALLGALYIASWGYVFFSHGKGLNNYFIDNAAFSDLFTPMKKSLDDSYFEPFFSNYPPLANLLFLLLKRFILREHLEDYAIFSTSLESQIILIIYFIFGAILLFSLMLKFIHDNTGEIRQRVLEKVLVVEILMSGPVLFLFSRGNNLIYVLVLLLVYALHYEDSNKFLKETALISLALATALKIYPVFFGILLLKKDNLKAAIRTCLYGALFMFGPFVFFGGFSAILQFIQNVFTRDSANVLNHIISFKGGFQIISCVLTGKVLVNIPRIIGLFPIILGIYIYLFKKVLWKKWFGITLIAIWFPNGSYLYNYVMLIIPLLLLLKEKEKDTLFTYIYLIFFALLFTPTFFSPITKVNLLLDEYALGNITWNMFLVNIIFILLVITIVMEEYINRIQQDFKGVHLNAV